MFYLPFVAYGRKFKETFKSIIDSYNDPKINFNQENNNILLSIGEQLDNKQLIYQANNFIEKPVDHCKCQELLKNENQFSYAMTIFKQQNEINDLRQRITSFEANKQLQEIEMLKKQISDLVACNIAAKNAKYICTSKSYLIIFGLIIIALLIIFF